MRATLLIVLVASMAVAALAQAPQAPIVKRDNLAGDITSCPIGQGLATNARPYRCAPCLAGYYKADTTLTGCLACPINSWSPQGSKECYVCPSGTSTEAHEASAACIECPYGQVLDYAWQGANPTLRCTACAVNQYQPLAGQKACLNCPPSMTTNGATGSGECFAATAGGNTIASTSTSTGSSTAAGAGAAKSLLQVLSQRVNAAAKPKTKGVAPSTAAPVQPQIVKRASFKGRTSSSHRSETAARDNAAKAKASKAKSRAAQKSL